MPRARTWTNRQLVDAAKTSRSLREVLKKLGLIPAGGNYTQVRETLARLKISTEHFSGQGWNVGWGFDPRIPAIPLDNLLVKDSPVQSHKLKNKLFAAGIKTPQCELCGWCKKSLDGRIPVELDHINGDHSDNRLENLRILCPNCHSLQSTHRGRNKKVGPLNSNPTR